MDEQAYISLRNRIKGIVVLPGDKAYEDLRQVLFNHAAKPAVIVQCRTADDVTAALEVVRRQRLTVSVRSGGHSNAGFSSNDDGMVIDVSPMNTVQVIDEPQRIVRVGAGALWGNVARQLEGHQLAITSGDTTTVGVGGLSLGGGIGWLVRTDGLSIDSLEAVELVLADGRRVRANANDYADLFWAVRGGGGNFGVATAFEFRAQPNKGVIAGTITFAATERKQILTGWFEYMRRADEKLNTTVMLMPGFGPGATPQVILNICYADTDEVAAKAALQPLRQLAPALSDNVTSKAYADTLESAASPKMQVTARNGFVKTVTPELIDRLSDNFGKPNTPLLQIRSLGGAMSRIAPTATAFEHRDVEALLVMPSFSPLDTSKAEAKAIADKQWAPVKPFIAGSYIGFLSDGSKEQVAAAYSSDTYERLARIKTIYDPTNLFDQNVNILPAHKLK